MKKIVLAVLVTFLAVPFSLAGIPAALNGVIITTNPDWVEECEYVGEVRAGSSWGGLTMKKVAEKKTYKKPTR